MIALLFSRRPWPAAASPGPPRVAERCDPPPCRPPTRRSPARVPASGRPAGPEPWPRRGPPPEGSVPCGNRDSGRRGARKISPSPSRRDPSKIDGAGQLLVPDGKNRVVRREGLLVVEPRQPVVLLAEPGPAVEILLRPQHPPAQLPGKGIRPELPAELGAQEPAKGLPRFRRQQGHAGHEALAGRVEGGHGDLQEAGSIDLPFFLQRVQSAGQVGPDEVPCGAVGAHRRGGEGNSMAQPGPRA